MSKTVETPATMAQAAIRAELGQLIGAGGAPEEHRERLTHAACRLELWSEALGADALGDWATGLCQIGWTSGLTPGEAAAAVQAGRIRAFEMLAWVA